MQNLLKISWLIPVLPFAGSILVAILLVSFNRTTNRLTKPISVFFIGCIFFSTVLSGLIFSKHITGVAFESGIDIPSLNYIFNLYINDHASASSLIVEALFLMIMIYSFKTLDRKNGYIRYFITLGILSGSILAFVFSGETFNSFLEPISTIAKRLT